MRLPTFSGGVDLPGGKFMTGHKKIERYGPKGDLVFPMRQHIGTPCTPLVEVGEYVFRGQKIADADAFLSAPVLSSVSGTVVEIAARKIPGGEGLCVVIRNDGRCEREKPPQPREDYRTLSPEECIRIVREAGIVGLGGARFPTHVKLASPPDKKISLIIANGAECKPYLNSDNRLMQEEPERIVRGLEVCLHLFPDAEGVLAVEDDKPESIASLEKALADRDGGRLRVVPLSGKYPQGAEKMLIYAVSGKKVPTGGLPADVGCIVLNVRTLYQIGMAVIEGVPLEERVVTVAGDAVADPRNLLVPLGTSIRELLEECGGFTEKPAKILVGGPMMGITLESLDVPVEKGTSGVLALSGRISLYPPESNCIRCGRCVEACPMFLVPSTLDFLVRAKAYEEFEAAGGPSCIECGCCAYVCPAARRLVAVYREGKAALKNAGAKGR